MPSSPPDTRTSVPTHPAFARSAVGAARTRVSRPLILLAALACAGPVPARAATSADLPALERAWHGCVREAYDSRAERGPKDGAKDGSKGVRERQALAACKAHEDAYVSALMASRPEDDALSLSGWARTWAAYVAVIVDPVAAWFEALRR